MKYKGTAETDGLLIENRPLEVLRGCRTRVAKRSKRQRSRFHNWHLIAATAVALQLDDFAEELYSDDVLGTPIEDLIPDYSILDQISYRYPVNDAYFAYASRGCIRKCSFCGVPKLEGDQRDVAPLTLLVRGVEELYGPKKDLTLMDNNIVASPRFKEIIAEIRDLGFERCTDSPLYA